MNREGPRKENCASLRWDNLTLEGLSGAGHVVLDVTKNGRGGSWALDPSTAEAFRRWKKVCPSEVFVFPAAALGGLRRGDRPMYVDKLAAELRDDLKTAKVDRPKLFEENEHRMKLRAHDLRGTFVTLSLANGKTEAWVQQRTGHTSSIMINRYRRMAMTAEELGLGPLLPMHRIIPELAKLGGDVPILADKPRPSDGDILVVQLRGPVTSIVGRIVGRCFRCLTRGPSRIEEVSEKHGGGGEIRTPGTLPYGGFQTA
jgi:hypothetical protein